MRNELFTTQYYGVLHVVKTVKVRTFQGFLTKCLLVWMSYSFSIIVGANWLVLPPDQILFVSPTLDEPRTLIFLCHDLISCILKGLKPSQPLKYSPRWGCRAYGVAEGLCGVWRTWNILLPCNLWAHAVLILQTHHHHKIPFPEFWRVTTMIRFLFLHISLARRCFGQLKRCYYDNGQTSHDLPCDPSANVSACCGQNWLCSTNFYCSMPYGNAPGSCTDKTWHDPACPLSLSQPHFPSLHPVKVAPWQHWADSDAFFNYSQNTTACGDGTFCPHSQNTTCCFNHQGVSQIVYHYKSPLPTAVTGLSDFYAANGYQIATVPSSFSDTLSTNALSVSTSVSSVGTTASPTEPTALPSIFPAEPSTHETASSALSSSTKADVGVGVAVGVSLAGGLLYFLIRRLRRQPQRDMAHAGTSTNAGVTMSGSRRYEKPELTGEDARKEMDAAERRKAELPGQETVMEVDATPAENRVIYELLV